MTASATAEALRGAIDACLEAGAALPGALERGDLEVLRDVAAGELSWSFALYEKLALMPRLHAQVDEDSDLGFADALEAIDAWIDTEPWPYRFALDADEVAALGYEETSRGIDAARRKHRKAWWAHEKRCRDFIEAAAERCEGTARAVMLGVGQGGDLPLEALAERFETLELVEIDGPTLEATVKRRLGRADCRIVTRVGDVTGIADELVRRAEAGDELEDVFESYRLDGAPALTEPGADLVVSSMLLSQLTEGVGRRALEGVDPQSPAHRAWAQLTHRVQGHHVRGLLACASTVALISDVAEQRTEAVGKRVREASGWLPMIGSPSLRQRVPRDASVEAEASWTWHRLAPRARRGQRGQLGSRLAIEALALSA